MSSVALITGITGQDGSYLAEHLLERGYEVHGIVRRSSQFNTSRIDHIFDRLMLHHGDVTDALSMRAIVAEVCPDECYHLAGQSHVAVSFEVPAYTSQVIVDGTRNLLDALRHEAPECRVYIASSSEMFGNSEAPQDEQTPMVPVSPYGCAKLHAHHMAGMYREAYKMPIWRGIAFNHESPRRGPTFVTQKIVRAGVRIMRGQQECICHGSLRTKRDWGYAPEYVAAMHAMLQTDSPDDYVLATGQTRSIHNFAAAVFGMLGIDFDAYSQQDECYRRPIDIGELCGDASKARRILGWAPKTGFDELVRIMVDAEVGRVA